MFITAVVVCIAIDELWEYWQLSTHWKYQCKVTATATASSQSASANVCACVSWYQV